MSPDDTIATRASLLNRLKDQSDQSSWQEFFDIYWRLIYSVAVKAGLNDPEAQDVVQETVISVARNVGEFRYDPKVCSFKTWMLRLTRWRILDRLRQREREAAGLGHRIHVGHDGALATSEQTTDRTSTLDRLPAPGELDLEKIWNEEWQKTTMETALAAVRMQISPEHYQAFDLYALKRLPVAKVARLVGMSIPRVYLAKHRIAALLKAEVRRMESTPPGQDR
jgi:RNA polymerase sigma factor (sigma-70 family)